MNNLDSRTEYILSKLTDGSKLVSICWRAGQLFRGTSKGWKNGLIGASWSLVTTSVKSCILYEITLCKYMDWALTGKEAALLKKTWGFWWTKPGNTSQLYAFAAQENDWLHTGSISKCCQQAYEIIISLYLAFLTLLELSPFSKKAIREECHRSLDWIWCLNLISFSASINNIPAYTPTSGEKAALWNTEKIVSLVPTAQDSIKENILQNLGIFVLISATLLMTYSLHIEKYSIQMFAECKSWGDVYGFSNHGL